MSGVNLAERIRRGEAAIARAKATGRDVPAWKRHLAELMRRATDPNYCWNCGEPWSEIVTDIESRRWRVCWRPTCSKTA